IYIIVALAFMACEKTIYIGGYAIDVQSKDSIEGIEMGLYVPKPEYSYENPKWSDLELIASATTNSEGFFSMEIDKETDVSLMFYFPLPPIDTLSVNAQYTNKGGQNFGVDYGAKNKFELGRSSNVQIKLINFTQEEINIEYADVAIAVNNITYSVYLQYDRPFTGQQYKFNFYLVDGEYLGSSSCYIKTQMPEDGDKVDWLMPLQVIEIDLNSLEK
ncbi:MAG: hypothetical protein JXR22_10010, partial [Prolixibacteraceae bacterium]|nr:hypothetical protein [Prolixibacteraceae bacterium]